MMADSYDWNQRHKKRQPPNAAEIIPLPPAHTVNGNSSYGAKALADELYTLANTGEGARNDQLNKSAFNLAQLVAAGHLDPVHTQQQLRVTALMIGSPASEIDGTLRSAFRAGVQQPRVVPELKPKVDEVTITYDPETGEAINPSQAADQQPQRRLNVIQASTIQMKATRWIYEDEHGKWIPLGAFVLLGGREGVGKSTVAYDIIGKITRGELPGHLYGHPKSVIVCATEDAWAETIVPRLVAAGADLNKVWQVNAVTPEGFEGSLSLPEDTERLRQIITEQDVALVLLDPLMSTINVKLDSHKDAEVRQALEPIVNIAHINKVSVIGLIHENKTGASDLLNRIMGSKAFTAVVRGVLYACREQQQDELDDFFETVEQQNDYFLFGQLKNNLGPRVRVSLRYHISGEQVGHDDDLNLPIWSSKIAWDDINNTHIQDVVTEQERPKGGRITEGDKVARWLKRYLTGKGEVPSEQVLNDAEDEGFARSTVQRARKNKTDIVVTNIHGTAKTTWQLTTK